MGISLFEYAARLKYAFLPCTYRTHRIAHNTLALTDMPSNVQGVVPQPIASGSALRGAPQQALHPTPTIPNCRYPNCGRPVTRDEVSHELTEYCSPGHMRFVVLVLQGPPCSCSCQWC